MGWLTGWNYRKSCKIKQQVGAGVGYQVLVKAVYDTYNVWDDVTVIGSFEGSNPVVTCGGVGDWDRYIRETGNVLYEPDDTGKEFKMFYSGKDTAGNVYIGYAYSSDGKSWTKANIVVGDLGKLNIPRQLEDPYVLNVDGTYHLYVEDKDSYPTQKPIRKYHTNNLEGAWVDDGIVLSNTDGDAEGWENALVGSPIVFKEGATWHMIYEGYAATAHGEVGIATSADGVNWTRDIANNPVFSPNVGWDSQQVVCDGLWKVDGVYHMSYHGYNGATWHIGIAASSDLISWVRHPNNPIHGSGCATNCSDLQVVYIAPTYYCYYTLGDLTAGIYMGYPNDPSIIEVNLEGHSRVDFADVRFTDSTGTSLLSYWLEEKVNSDYGLFWVKINDNLTDGDATIYIYYGKADATSISNGVNTWDYFYDPEGDVIGDNPTGWNCVESPPNQTLKVSNEQAKFGTKSVKYNNLGEACGAIGTKSISKTSLRRLVWMRTAQTNSQCYFDTRDGDNLNSIYICFYHTALIKYYDIAWHSLGGYSANQWYRLEVVCVASSGKFNIKIDGVWHNNLNLRGIPSTFDIIRHSGWYSGYFYHDIEAIGKYIDPEPEYEGWGVEESPPATPTNPNSGGYNEVTNEIGFTWTDIATDEAGYIVEVSIDGGITWIPIADLPADSTSYNDGNIICGTYYLYRVKAYNDGGDSGYATLTTPIYSYDCPIFGMGITREWQYNYRFKPPPFKVKAHLIIPIKETKSIRGKISSFFEETKRVIGRRFADKFQETKLIGAIIKKPFEETSPIECAFIVSFEETQQVLASITWEFSLTIYAKIMGKITTEEKEYLNELRWL